MRSGGLQREITAVVAAFGVNGLCFAAWLSRTPAMRDSLSLSPAGLGLLLVCLSGGACLTMPLVGRVVQRRGAARTVLLGTVGTAIGLTGVAIGVATSVRWPVAVGLVLTGIGMSAWDVAMNVAGADVERRLGRALMPRLHAAFSLGTVAGAGVGALTAAHGTPLAVQILGAAVLAVVTIGGAVRWFPPQRRVPTGPVQNDSPGAPCAAWREPRTWTIGVLTCAFAFTEGSANDWMAVAMVDGHHGGQVLGAVGFGVFVTAMTVGRLAGGAALDRFGRVAVLRVCAAIALTGLILVITGAGPGWALAGAALWGLGASLGFPVGMSAAADDPARAPTRVAMVSSIAYTAFLGGPPLIGLLADHMGILHALIVVAGALTVALLAAGATRSPAAPEPLLITDAYPSAEEQQARRRRTYSIIMGIHIVGFAVSYPCYLVRPWLGAAVIGVTGLLPWVGVILANDGPRRDERLSRVSRDGSVLPARRPRSPQ
ncbi:MAG TPA: MFS transporter [Pseudonocardia sp.]